MTCILLVIIASLMTYVSQLREEVIQINKKLDKVIKHLGIENYSNIDDELRILF
ncbi:hypothetical protein [Clostridium sp. 1001275B_160808_H3]|uniref:hypothetical protein n=1 Tax=Clostridium sp. 1001275B_160808_H3 TaxID=2787110 RepID=UPI00189A24A7|nr:hypothetical protein [Clostridium sp. 1001275B_160808_H3]